MRSQMSRKNNQFRRSFNQGTKMHTPATILFRQSYSFMRFTALLVLVAFTSFILEPAALAIRTAEAATPTATTTPTVSDEAKLSKSLQQAEHHILLMEDKLAKGQDVAAERQALAALRTEIGAMDQIAMANFNSIKEYILQKGFPDIILQRHTDTDPCP